MRAAWAPEWRNRGGVKRRVPERGKSTYEIRTLRHDFVLSAHDRPGRRTSFVPTDMMNHPSGIQPNTQTASPAQPYHFHTDGIVVLGTGPGDAFVKATNASRRTSFVPTDMMNHPSGIQPNTQTASPAQPYHFHTDGIVVLGTGLGDAFVKATNASRFQTRIVPLLDAKDGGPTAATQIHKIGPAA